jgi:hypothetical protein
VELSRPSPIGPPGPFRKASVGRGHLVALKAAVRQQFRLPETAVVFINERNCSHPGTPPRETICAFWTAEGTRRQFRVFKPMAEVAAADFPPWWMRDVLPETDETACDCC